MNRLAVATTVALGSFWLLAPAASATEAHLTATASIDCGAATGIIDTSVRATDHGLAVAIVDGWGLEGRFKTSYVGLPIITDGPAIPRSFGAAPGSYLIGVTVRFSDGTISSDETTVVVPTAPTCPPAPTTTTTTTTVPAAGSTTTTSPAPQPTTTRPTVTVVPDDEQPCAGGQTITLVDVDHRSTGDQPLPGSASFIHCGPPVSISTTSVTLPRTGGPPTTGMILGVVLFLAGTGLVLIGRRS